MKDSSIENLSKSKNLKNPKNPEMNLQILVFEILKNLKIQADSVLKSLNWIFPDFPECDFLERAEKVIFGSFLMFSMVFWTFHIRFRTFFKHSTDLGVFK